LGQVGPPGISGEAGGPDHATAHLGCRVTGFNARPVPKLLCAVADEPSHFPFALDRRPALRNETPNRIPNLRMVSDCECRRPARCVLRVLRGGEVAL